MNCMKKMISDNSLLTYAVMSILGMALGIAASKILLSHCCCCSSLKHKARRAFRAVEDKIL